MFYAKKYSSARKYVRIERGFESLAMFRTTCGYCIPRHLVENKVLVWMDARSARNGFLKFIFSCRFYLLYNKSVG